MRRLRRALVRWVARAKPLIPEAAWPTLLAARSMAGDGPLIGMPAARRVLVLAAHPDDESLGCAGTVALLSDRGAKVSMLFATDGEGTRGSPAPPADVAQARRSEAEASARLLGATAEFCGLPDGGLVDAGPALEAAVAGSVARAQPDLVFAPWPGDGHPDHRAVAEALARATLPADCEVWGYETWTALPANRLVDITSVIGTKESSIAVHQTAALAFDMTAGLGLSRWRSLHGLMGRGWAEGFLAVPAERYSALVAELRNASAS